MALWILRSVFLLVAAGVGVTLVNSPYLLRGADLWLSWLAFLSVLVVACGAIAIDFFTPRKRIDVISGVYFGIMVGLFLTYVAGVAFTPLLNSVTANLKMSKEGTEAVGAFVQLLLATILCYACISLLLQTKDDFRFIIPYVEFAREVKGLKPYLLDTSVVIDGRIADVIETGVLDNQLIMPRFILAELQGIADSHDKLKRTRGRRGLDVLNRLRNNEAIDLKMVDQEFPEMVGQPVDMKLVLLARRLDGKVVTGDYNLNKVAKLHNVSVVNLNELANCLKPVYLPGERFTVKVVKSGEEYNQGIGYLDDGTMIVVENGREHIGEAIEVEVTSVLQKSAGRMIFSRADASAKSA